MRVVASPFDSPNLCSSADSPSASAVLFNFLIASSVTILEAICTSAGRTSSKTRVIAPLIATVGELLAPELHRMIDMRRGALKPLRGEWSFNVVNWF
jgi:hypothetical protein